jgi:hypothetical protein
MQRVTTRETAPTPQKEAGAVHRYGQYNELLQLHLLIPLMARGTVDAMV